MSSMSTRTEPTVMPPKPATAGGILQQVLRRRYKATTASLLMTSFFILFLLLGNSCDPGSERDIRDYYFPVKTLSEGLVYEYTPVGQADSLRTGAEYWYYRSLPTDSAIYLTVAFYDRNFTPTQLSREQLTNAGMYLRDLYLYETDSSGRQQQVRTEILSPLVFPFSLRPAQRETFPYRLRFQLPSQPHGTTTLNLYRQYAGDTTVVFRGKPYDALVFNLTGSVDQRDSLLGDIEPAFSGQEIYAKKLGLYAYWRDYGGAALRYRLSDTYPMSRLEAKSRRAQQ